jgi:DNA-binding MarR family transcriptional regulator
MKRSAGSSRSSPPADLPPAEEPPGPDLPDYTRSQGAAALGGRLRRLSERIDRDAARVYAELGVPFEQRWFGVVNLLAVNGPMSVGELAESLGISHVSVSQTRDSLARAGLISGRRDPQDARRRTLHLTRKGIALVERLTPVWAALAAAAIELEGEAGEVLSALDRLDAVLQRRSLYERVLARLRP